MWECVQCYVGELLVEICVCLCMFYFGFGKEGWFDQGMVWVVVVSVLIDVVWVELEVVLGCVFFVMVVCEFEIVVGLCLLCGQDNVFDLVCIEVCVLLLGDLLIVSGLLLCLVFDVVMQCYCFDLYGCIGDYLVNEVVILCEVIEEVVWCQCDWLV